MARKKRAAKKKTRRAKKAKKVVKKVAKKVKKVAKKAKKKKKVARRTKAPARKKIIKATAAGVQPKPAAPPVKPAAPQPLLNEERVGAVTHYYTHLGVAVIQLDRGFGLREGDVIHIKGFTSDFTQRVGSMEIDHLHVNEARPGQSFGLKVREHAREHDVVYRLKTP